MPCALIMGARQRPARSAAAVLNILKARDSSFGLENKLRLERKETRLCFQVTARVPTSYSFFAAPIPHIGFVFLTQIYDLSGTSSVPGIRTGRALDA